MEIDPVFPHKGEYLLNQTDKTLSYSGRFGLSKREYFAALAMQALASNSSFTDAQCEMNKNRAEAISTITDQSVEMADSLILALQETGHE